MDVMFQKLALRGTSIMFASGDGGVAGGQSGACRPGASPFQGVLLRNGCSDASRCPPAAAAGEVFVPTFPSGSPYVTSVGATNTLNDAAASFSSGGFSNMCGRAQGKAPSRCRMAGMCLPASQVRCAALPGRAHR